MYKDIIISPLSLLETPLNYNELISLSTYLLKNFKKKYRKVELIARFVIPESDTPKERTKEYIRPSLWVDLAQEKSPISQNAPTFAASDNVLVPGKKCFNYKIPVYNNTNYAFTRKLSL